MADKLFSTDHEVAVLSTLLKYPDLYYGTGVRFFMMSAIPHQIIYQEIEVLNEKQLVPDALMVLNSLDSSGNLAKVGGKSYIDQLLAKDYNKENLKEYCNLLIASYKGRVFVSSASKVKADALTLDNVEDSIRDFKKTLDTLSEVSGGGGTVHIGDGIKKSFEDIVSRTANPGVRGHSWGIKDIDVTTGGKSPGDWWIIGGRPSQGKCLGYGTKVMMLDGKFKSVEDIRTGDKLMGPDSKERTVLSTTTGIEQMYWVRQNKGIDYRVNESHILSLKRSKTEKLQAKGSIRNMSVSSILPHQSWVESRFKGYKVSVNFKNKPVKVDPYFVGLWLGDGNSRNMKVYNTDAKVIDYIFKYAKDSLMAVSVGDLNRSCKSFTINNHHKGNFILDEFHRYDLINNKHIPDDYMYTDRQSRLKLLAGLIDSDGSNTGYGGYEITQKNEVLANQIKFLGDTLGYRSRIHRKVAQSQLGTKSIVWRVTLYGDMSDVPVLLDRKKIINFKRRTDWSVTGIHIERDIVDRYYGFELSGDGLFLLEDLTVTHNTALLCNSILTDGRNGIPILFFEKEMNYQSLVERLVAIDSGVPIQNIRLGIIDKGQMERIGESMKRIRQYPIYIDTTFNSDIHYLESTIFKYKTTKKIEVVYIDYLQLLAERDDNQTQELGKISRTCKLLANDQGVCIIGASQLNRGVEMRDNKRPVMSDLRQSGNLEEDADFVIGLYRDEYYNKETKYKNMMEFLILKARNGPVGTVTIKFDPEANKLENK